LKKESKTDEWERIDAEKIAEALAEYFFTNGNGDKATHLNLLLEGGSYGGGWGRAPFKDYIKTVMSATTEDENDARY